MPPNHDSRNSQNTQRDFAQSSETTSTTNLPLESNHTLENDQPLFEKTFAIVQYVIFSLLGRKVNRIPSREAKKVRELTSEILAKHDVYNSLCLNLGFTPDNLEGMFYGVAENIFEDGLINWGRLIALLGFSVKVSQYFRSQGVIVNPDQIVELTTCFIVHKTGPWIHSKGGWENVITHFNNSKNEAYSPKNATWFRGILVTATATIGLGALLAVTQYLPLLQATEHFKTILKTHATTLPSQRLANLIDFVFSFFFNHFHLYKFVFTNERDVDKKSTHLSVQTPPQDLPALGKGTEKSEWERQQVLKKMEEQHNRKIMEKQLQLDSEIERLQSRVHDKLSLLNTEQPITAEDLNNIVEETVRIYVAEAGSTIQHLIEENQENLVYEFERSAVGQDVEKNVKTSAGKAKSPGTGLGKKKAKVGKPAKG